ncbi:transmembrane protein 62-like [Anthonomus grandis grandis]|uniref:transmembrane protein 62-like n=1 Tax=Anthonomus grandis grandis TaxID=2921223 RepID=UPI002165F7BF|nr:transmembrane protein 62-like [Anthonomus grandis grandis]
MKITKAAIGVCVSMIFFGIYLANIFSIISTHQVHPDEHLRERFFKIGDRFDNLIWFLQISDIHISIFRDPSRIVEFKEFCHYTIDRILPSVVLATGDLTDAKTKDAIGSQQYESEWRHYRDILREFDIDNKTVWLDIRGNHDNFNVISVNSKHNFFTNYSIQGKEHPRSYMMQVRKGNSKYTFLGVDACLEPGPRRPFNFVGMLDEPEVIEIKKLLKETESSGSNYTIWFGHFPTSCILSSGSENIRNLIKKDPNSLAYLCGHLHTLGGVVPRMYTMQKGGFLELELGDWKDNRMYRLMAIDHGMFSFVDVAHRDWPVVLITNPKNALFFNPLKENVDNIRQSTHIRVLAFSMSRIKTVRIRINDEPWTDLKHIRGPLYVTSWDAMKYKKGLHQIEVYAKDIDGREKTEQTLFSLDGTKLSFGVLPRLALMSNLSQIFWSFYIITLVVYLLPLVLMKYLHKAVSSGLISQPRLRGSVLKTWIRKVWILTTVDRIFWPIMLYPVYLVFGPWSIGYIVEDYIGVIFSWGIFVDGAFLPGSFTYAYGFVQMITFQFPLTFILISAVNRRYVQLTLNTGKKLTLRQAICTHLPFCVVFTVQLIMAYLFWLAYGTMAFILGPLRTWSLVLAAFMYYAALRLPEKCFRRAKEICFTKSETTIDQDAINLALEQSAEKVGGKTN